METQPGGKELNQKINNRIVAKAGIMPRFTTKGDFMFNIKFVERPDKLGLISPFNQKLVNYMKRSVKAKWVLDNELIDISQMTELVLLS